MTATATIVNPAAAAPSWEEPSAARPTSNLFMSRKPIYDAKFAPLGYEMRLHGEPGQLANRNSFFFDAFLSLPPQQLLGNSLAFIHCEADEIVPDFEEIVDPRRIVIDLAAPKGNQNQSLMAENVASLCARGFRVGVGEYALQSEYRNLLDKVDYLKIDTRRIEPLVLQVLPRRLARIKPLKLIAAHLLSAEAMETMKTAEYHGFHGTLQSQKISGTVKTIDSSRQSILMLMRLVQKEATANEIEEGLKRDPGLSFNLMRYVNSAAFIQYSKTTTLKRAAQLLGNQKLYRWLSMRLMASSKHPAQSLMLRAALTRGRMMELLAPDCTNRLSPDDAFLVGMFSLLSRLLGLPIEEALTGIELSSAVTDGLLHQGLLGKLLISVEACELPDEDILLTYEHELGIEGLLPMAHMNAIHWAESIINL